MKAAVGDKLVVEGTKGGNLRRTGLVIEVGHLDGSPPYRVRWLDDGRESLVFPGPDARVVPAGHAS
ncbi:DUF1918 domain-containing protein [Nonomuraea soli]|uniref:DUF1918 domain-containing protein n=1 Tax=Nonomuraea soli TaxID=1032476 RepID=A0A7W0CFD9_9ACTN|nr:DUF1918 domain-containing protein [Nonomuraea soli]MBA2890012.1 hypothetical protein [Nonomuraea soli]